MTFINDFFNIQRMTIFQIFSKKLNCNIELKYDTNGRLLGMEILTDAIECDELVRVKIFTECPSTVGELKQTALKFKLELTEIKPDLSFETFWVRYGKIGSKPKSEAIWNRMSEKNKNQAMNYISKYKQGLNGTSPAYANTWLNAQYWIK